jgi:hypothetical protein
MDPCLVQPPSPHTSNQSPLPTDPSQCGGCRGRCLPTKLTAHAHLGEGAFATLGLAYTESVAVYQAWLCALLQPVLVFSVGATIYLPYVAVGPISLKPLGEAAIEAIII